MTRLHDQPVEVARRDDAPAQFLWRDRLYLVREVLARWTESGAWWTTDVTASGRPDDAEREVFRVEAGAGRDSGLGVYDLALDTARGSWSLVRVLD